jgi:hypothetical protein
MAAIRKTLALLIVALFWGSILVVALASLFTLDV